MDTFNLIDDLLYKRYIFVITTPLDNVLFMSDQSVLIVTLCLLFNGSTKTLFLLESQVNIIYWLSRDELIVKHLVKSAYTFFLGINGARTVPHLCIFVGSWSVNISSRGSLFLTGYYCVDCNLSFLGQYVILLWRWAPKYAVKLLLS